MKSSIFLSAIFLTCQVAVFAQQVKTVYVQPAQHARVIPIKKGRVITDSLGKNTIPDSAFVKKEFRFKKSSGTIVINSSNVSIEGYEGNEVIFTLKVLSEDVDEKAVGLVKLSSSGTIDNTGIGLNVLEKNDQLEVKQVGKPNESTVVIRLPKKMRIVYVYNKSDLSSDDLKITNIENEIEISKMYGDVQLENITGPLTVKTIYGSVDAKLSKPTKGPISLVSVYGSIDVTLDQETKATINLSSDWGSIYALKEFKFEFEKQKRAGKARS